MIQIQIAVESRICFSLSCKADYGLPPVCGILETLGCALVLRGVFHVSVLHAGSSKHFIMAVVQRSHSQKFALGEHPESDLDFMMHSPKFKEDPELGWQLLQVFASGKGKETGNTWSFLRLCVRTKYQTLKFIELRKDRKIFHLLSLPTWLQQLELSISEARRQERLPFSLVGVQNPKAISKEPIERVEVFFAGGRLACWAMESFWDAQFIRTFQEHGLG